MLLVSGCFNSKVLVRKAEVVKRKEIRSNEVSKHWIDLEFNQDNQFM